MTLRVGTSSQGWSSPSISTTDDSSAGAKAGTPDPAKVSRSTATSVRGPELSATAAARLGIAGAARAPVPSQQARFDVDIELPPGVKVARTLGEGVNSKAFLLASDWPGYPGLRVLKVVKAESNGRFVQNADPETRAEIASQAVETAEALRRDPSFRARFGDIVPAAAIPVPGAVLQGLGEGVPYEALSADAKLVAKAQMQEIAAAAEDVLPSYPASRTPQNYLFAPTGHVTSWFDHLADGADKQRVVGPAIGAQGSRPLYEYYASESVALARLGAFGLQDAGSPKHLHHSIWAKSQTPTQLADELMRKLKRLETVPREAVAHYYAGMALRQLTLGVPIGDKYVESPVYEHHYSWASQAPFPELWREMARRVRTAIAGLTKVPPAATKSGVDPADLTGTSADFSRFERIGDKFDNGFGGGSFYKARDSHTGQLVGIKKFESADAAALEHELLQQLGAKTVHVPKVFGYDASERAMAVSFGGYRLGDRRLPTHEAVRVTRELLEALGGLHELGYIHCDLHPGNVLLAPGSGTARLIDYGNVRKLGPTGAFRGLPPFGDPTWWPPERGTEQPTNGKNLVLDCTSDLYAAGLLLVRMLGGNPREADLGLGHLPQGLVHALTKALAPNPSDRYPDAQSLSQALAPFMAPSPREQLSVYFGRESVALGALGGLAWPESCPVESDHYGWAAKSSARDVVDNLLKKLQTAVTHAAANNRELLAQFVGAFCERHGDEAESRARWATQASVRDIKALLESKVEQVAAPVIAGEASLAVPAPKASTQAPSAVAHTGFGASVSRAGAVGVASASGGGDGRERTVSRGTVAASVREAPGGMALEVTLSTADLAKLVPDWSGEAKVFAMVPRLDGSGQKVRERLELRHDGRGHYRASVGVDLSSIRERYLRKGVPFGVEVGGRVLWLQEGLDYYKATPALSATPAPAPAVQTHQPVGRVLFSFDRDGKPEHVLSNDCCASFVSLRGGDLVLAAEVTLDRLSRLVPECRGPIHPFVLLRKRSADGQLSPWTQVALNGAASGHSGAGSDWRGRVALPAEYREAGCQAEVAFGVDVNGERTVWLQPEADNKVVATGT